MAVSISLTGNRRREQHGHAHDEQLISFFCHLFRSLVDETFTLMHHRATSSFTGLLFSFSTRRFPGFNRDGKKFDADVHRQHIFGLHVANYMTKLKEDNPDHYAKQFSRFVKAGIAPTSVRRELFILSSSFSACSFSSKPSTRLPMLPSALIHRRPRRKRRRPMHRNPNGKKRSARRRSTSFPFSSSWNKVKLARSSRKNRVQQRKTAYLKTVHGADAE